MTNVSNESVEKKGSGSSASRVIASLAVVFCILFGYIIWKFVMGAPSNFENGDPNGHPLPGNFMGMVYKGGIVVAALIGLLTMTIVFSIERFFVISKASGKGNVSKFVQDIQVSINAGKISEAMEACDAQQGSVANVVKAGLVKYEQMKKEGFDSEEATEAIQKEIEEATTLEMPMLERNMIVLATLVSIGTLVGLLGTVTGMIKAFSALATSGTPDSAALATGISEALVCTATGIGTSTLAIVMYNSFTTKIDRLTYSIDEAGFAITQSYRRFRGLVK
ncbi:MotA/TolQ/ExbB proton channel family protein [Myroides marinus]|jgi:biopolymer transport protein ExbB|uniref:MotA/TolQ/ExbB proton channel family protein n=1 Tax=Myroides marinus TaxID=703342 RepID=UPI000741EBEF|nr:MotA/TolQ/ExbB proton channel family protein [Myroides marinus]MDR0194883.1 MotA/TolQ/ExbB proton channel family protein [Myroides sp.]KUF42072.1 flagellar motor protein MotA [Myroides marinus]MDM1348048.1 MotA/TolQ/ExbB proton channel family protein [Myroides marinus]MDM1351608.1 MotA/TolQ/ExbB proton channel family protein [Myroides marinus]MDM1355202.1 MotA/TolQ/ExbB proton channel family protein [Myroides marinus]